MAAAPDPAPARRVELAQGCGPFHTLLDRDTLNALQPVGPAAVYTPWVVVWLFVYQRLHANASLRDAVTELLAAVDGLPPHRRVLEQTLSANTGAYSRARTRSIRTSPTGSPITFTKRSSRPPRRGGGAVAC